MCRETPWRSRVDSWPWPATRRPIARVARRYSRLAAFGAATAAHQRAPPVGLMTLADPLGTRKRGANSACFPLRAPSQNGAYHLRREPRRSGHGPSRHSLRRQLARSRGQRGAPFGSPAPVRFGLPRAPGLTDLPSAWPAHAGLAEQLVDPLARPPNAPTDLCSVQPLAVQLQRCSHGSRLLPVASNRCCAGGHRLRLLPFPSLGSAHGAPSRLLAPPQALASGRAVVAHARLVRPEISNPPTLCRVGSRLGVTFLHDAELECFRPEFAHRQMQRPLRPMPRHRLVRYPALGRVI